VPFIIPERQAVQPADKAFEGDKIGSGPYVFSEKEWVPGAKTVYLRNKDYVPRSPPDYYAGARRAPSTAWVGGHPDPSTAVAALRRARSTSSSSRTIDQWPILPRIRTSP
jgi:peptide/nickel transport system substrate-binding protein